MVRVTAQTHKNKKRLPWTDASVTSHPDSVAILERPVVKPEPGEHLHFLSPRTHRNDSRRHITTVSIDNRSRHTASATELAAPQELVGEERGINEDATTD